MSAKKFNFFFKGRKNALNSYKGKKSNICMYEKKKITVLLIICPLRPQGGGGLKAKECIFYLDGFKTNKKKKLFFL